MSERTREKLHMIQADSISWLLQQTTDHIQKMLTDGNGWNIAELIAVTKWASEASEAIRNVTVPIIRTEK